MQKEHWSICPVLKNLQWHPISFRVKIRPTQGYPYPACSSSVSLPSSVHLGSPAFHAADNQALSVSDSSRASLSSSRDYLLLVLLIPAQTSHPQRRLLFSPLWSGHICLSQALHSIFPTARFTFMCDCVMTFVSLEYKLCGSGSHVALCSPLHPCAWHMVNAQ